MFAVTTRTYDEYVADYCLSAGQNNAVYYERVGTSLRSSLQLSEISQDDTIVKAISLEKPAQQFLCNELMYLIGMH